MTYQAKKAYPNAHSTFALSVHLELLYICTPIHFTCFNCQCCTTIVPGLFKIALKWDWFSSVFESLALNRLIFDPPLIVSTVQCLKLMACGKYLSTLIEEADESVMNATVQTVWAPQTFLNIIQL